jgi:type II secretory ATPase GspE/PulE/Tfp pilus assembly ATPase PilB-like protein
MNQIPEKQPADWSSKIKEAETYYSMGLLDEAFGTYREIMTHASTLGQEVQKRIKEKIEGLTKEIAERERIDSMTVSPSDISHFKKSVSNEQSLPVILDSASAFIELGLYGEAVAEYEKLFRLNYAPEKILDEIAACLFKTQSPQKVIEKIESILSRQNLDKKALARLRFHLGNILETKDHKNIALDIYRTARETDPDNNEIRVKLDSLAPETSSGSKFDYLLNRKKVTTEQLQQALSLSKKMKKSVEFVLLDYFKIKKEDLGKSLSLFYRLPYRTYEPQLPTPVELIRNLKKPFLLHELWVPLNWGKEGVEILIDDPRDLSKTDHIKALVKTKKINFSVAIKEDIESFIKRFFEDRSSDDSPGSEQTENNYEELPDISFEEDEETEEFREEVDESSSQVVKLVDQVIVSAFRKNASDIHIEPYPESKITNIRFRIDGVCQDYLKVPNVMAKAIISRIKIMGKLDIAERRLPQDGKIKFKRKGISPFELRIATIPTSGGFEDAVMRILAAAGAMKLEEMGLSERNLKVMKRIVAQPYGLVLVVGPTGSGKTTTLHAALGHINKPGVKIWTAEDPVEITQNGLRQVEARPNIGLDFARIMRAFLRADPDVIMIGEMRDEETASIGIEASLTGHLVFSTLHTNSAPETVTRLLDMGLNALNFSDAYLGVLAQRLVRRLCKECRKAYHPSKEEFEEIASEYGEEHFRGTGIEYKPDLMLHKPTGCEICAGTGYKGRLGIHELMEGTSEIKSLIKKQANSEVLFQTALKEGMTTLKQDGILKAFRGLTDMAEVRRVCIK